MGIFKDGTREAGGAWVDGTGTGGGGGGLTSPVGVADGGTGQTTTPEGAAALLAITPVDAVAKAFFVDAVAGNDASDGKTLGTAWLTTARMEAAVKYNREILLYNELLTFTIVGGDNASGAPLGTQQNYTLPSDYLKWGKVTIKGSGRLREFTNTIASTTELQVGGVTGGLQAVVNGAPGFTPGKVTGLFAENLTTAEHAAVGHHGSATSFQYAAISAWTPVFAAGNSVEFYRHGARLILPATATRERWTEFRVEDCELDHLGPQWFAQGTTDLVRVFVNGPRLFPEVGGGDMILEGCVYNYDNRSGPHYGSNLHFKSCAITSDGVDGRLKVNGGELRLSGHILAVDFGDWDLEDNSMIRGQAAAGASAVLYTIDGGTITAGITTPSTAGDSDYIRVDDVQIVGRLRFGKTHIFSGTPHFQINWNPLNDIQQSGGSPALVADTQRPTTFSVAAPGAGASNAAGYSNGDRWQTPSAEWVLLDATVPTWVDLTAAAPYVISVCPFGAKSDGTGRFLLTNGKTSDGDDTSKDKTRQAVPVPAGITSAQLIALVHYSKEADLTTVMKAHVNGLVVDTITLAPNANGAGQEAMAAAVADGDYVEIEYDANQQPGECAMSFLLEVTP